MLFKKKLTLIFVILLVLLPLVLANTYSAKGYGCGLFGIGCTASTPTPAPTPDSPGGGGGSSCSYDWECTNWFPAQCPASEVQERICANKGTCNGIAGIPVQTQTCEYIPTSPLFDIFLTLPDKNKEICSGEKIEAKIRLENYGKIELLDAFMTYWIIDKNNTLITELKDTRAVTTSKDFEVELKLHEEVPSGTYRIYAQINYDGNKTAVAGESFEIISKENCSLYSRFDFNWNYLIYGGVGIIVIFIIFGLIKLIARIFKGKKKKVRRIKSIGYKGKVKENLTKIRSKKALPVVLGLIATGILVLMQNNITGFVVSNGESIKTISNILYFMLVIGCLGILSFIYGKKVQKRIETKKRDKYSKDSIKGLGKKKVYTEDGVYIGKIKDIILSQNKIYCLRVKLIKRFVGKRKGIIIKYKDIKKVGHIVIVDESVKEFLEELNI